MSIAGWFRTLRRWSAVVVVALAATVATSSASSADSVSCTSASWSCAGAGYSANASTWAETYFGWTASTTLGWTGFDGHNCTRYAAYRLAKNGLADPGFSYGMAYEWDNKAGSANTTPAVGAIAQWEAASWNYYSGHVAYVEAVSSTSITITEDSWGGGTQTRIISVGSSVWPNHFIHKKDVAATKAFTTAPAPKITGTLRVDSTLAASVGVWSPTPTSYTYQWRREGAAISGATAATYKLTQSDIGKRISLSVAAVKSGYVTTTKTSAYTGAVTAYVLSGTTSTPTLSGTVKQGSTLTSKPGTWSVSGATIRYQWKRNGSSISGATATTYKLGESDIGKKITFTVTASRTGYQSISKASAATATVVSTYGTTLKAGSTLPAGRALYSADGKYKFVQQGDGNLVLYNRATGKAVWATGKMTSGTRTVMQTDGNLVQYTSTNKVMWASGTAGKGGNRVVVQTDGNVVIYTSTGKAVWATNTVGK